MSPRLLRESGLVGLFALVLFSSLIACDRRASDEVPRGVPTDFTAIDEGIPEAVFVDRRPPHEIVVTSHGAEIRLEVIEAQPVPGRRGAWDFRSRRPDGAVVAAALRWDGEAGVGHWNVPGVVEGAYSTR